MAFNVPAKPLLLSSQHSLSQFFPCAVILQECVVSEDCSLAFLKGPETTQDAGRLALHPGFYYTTSLLMSWGLKRGIMTICKKIKRQVKRHLLLREPLKAIRDEAVNADRWYVQSKNRQRHAVKAGGQRLWWYITH